MAARLSPLRAAPLGLPGGQRRDLPPSLSERIRLADGKSPAELAALAAEVKDSMQNIESVEPEIREMLLRRQRAMAAQDPTSTPRTPEAAEPEGGAPQVRRCCCGCGMMLVCGSGEDAAMTEMHMRHFAHEPPAAPADAAAQRARCAQMARPRRPPAAREAQEAPTPSEGRARQPDYGRLSEMARPREAPPPPPPEPPFRALPAPSLGRAHGMGKPSRSAPNLLASAATPPAAESPHFRPPAWAPSEPSLLAFGSGDRFARLAELRCHSMKAKRAPGGFTLPPVPGGGLFPPLLGAEDADGPDFGRAPARKRHVSATAQRRYTEEHLYQQPKGGKPGSIEELQARLETIKRENQARQALEESPRKPRTRAKHALHKGAPPEIAADIS